MDALHVSVLLHECIENLNIRPDGIYVDGTLGMGGHSEQIAARLTTGKLIGIDRDRENNGRIARNVGNCKKWAGISPCNFSALPL